MKFTRLLLLLKKLAALQEKWQKKKEKRILHFEQEIELGRGWQETAHEAELLQAYFFKLKKGMKDIEIEDWETEGQKRLIISLDPTLEPREELEQRFKKSRKLKKKLEMAEKLLKKAKAESLPLSLPAQKAPPHPLYPVKKHPFHEFTTKNGLKIYAGKRAQDNDQLSLVFARGSDYWFHVAKGSGSHVILRADKSEEPDEESIQDALQIALYYSKARGRDEEVIVSQAKYISKPKGAKPGLVITSKHKIRLVQPNLSRLTRLMNKI